MGEFLSEAPTLSLVLSFLALLLVLIPLPPHVIRHGAPGDQQEPAPLRVQEQRPSMLELVGWALFAASLAVYLFSD